VLRSQPDRQNTDYKASLIPGKVYRIIPGSQAAKDDVVRIVDESGEDYLYHKTHFVFVDFPRAIAKRIRSLEATTA
jgi:hypothetical protein